MMIMKWFVKEYEDEDKLKVFKLRKDVYGVSFDPCEWDWKFKNSQILIAINEDDEAVGLRPTVMMKLKHFDKIIKVGMNVDVMTHPKYRRMGIFSGLVKKSHEKLRDSGVNLVYTFPNQFSFPGYINRIKWTKVSSLPLMVKPMNTENLLKKYFNNMFLNLIVTPFAKLGVSILFRDKNIEYEKFSIKKLDKFDDNFDRLWAELSSKFKITVVRDSKFLNWRYVERPGYNYDIMAAFKNEKLVGYIVTRTDEMFGVNLGLIVDILAVDNDSACFLIENAVGNLSNVDVVGCLMLEHVSYFDDLKKVGFRKIPQRYSPKEFYFVANADEEEIGFGNYLEKNWYITFGDIDIA